MRFKALIPALLILMLTQSAFAVKIADITRMYGARNNVLIGMGLVTGLKGTGDGGAFLPAMRPLAGMFGKFQNPASIADLGNAANVAIVNVYATLPVGGVSNGDHLDVRVSSIGAAVSLKYGTLFNVSLVGPDGKPYTPHDPDGHPMKPIPFATATGSIDFEDPSNLTNGVVKGGAVMEVDLPARYIDRSGRFTLIIDDVAGSWVMASNIAKLINESNESGASMLWRWIPREWW